MTQAFLAGAFFAAGFCSVATVFGLAAAAAVMAWERSAASRRRRVIREAAIELNEMDIAAMLRGFEGDGPRVS